MALAPAVTVLYSHKEYVLEICLTSFARFKPQSNHFLNKSTGFQILKKDRLLGHKDLAFTT